MNALILLVALLGVTDYPKDDSVNFAEWKASRPNFTTGFGPIIDELEQMNTGLDGRGRPHPMKNAADPGNWAHELTHLINGQMRNEVFKMKKRPCNTFYVMERRAVTLFEPKVTLKKIADLVPKAERGEDYQSYLVQQQRWWNNQPLYVLDEASAAGNALYYQISVQKVDKKRESLARQWATYAKYLVTAVEKYDSDYDQLDKLRAYVEWNNRRLTYLADLHRQLWDQKAPAPPKPYQIW